MMSLARVNARRSTMESDQLFLATLQDLRRLVSHGDDYSMLRASALLRQLLLNGSALVHIVNRGPRLKLRFPVCGRAYTAMVIKDGAVFYSALGGIHSSGPMERTCEMISLDQFLATIVLKLGDQILTVHHLIDIAANVLGGVHKGEPEDAMAKALAEFSRVVSIAGQTITSAQMRPVILVVLDALQPLEALLSTNPQSGQTA